MDIKHVHAYWPEEKGFTLEMDCKEDFYVFIHFHTEVELADGNVIKPGGCILYKPNSYRYFKAKKCTLYHDWMNIDGNLEELITKYNIQCNHVYYPINDYKITDIISDIETEKQFNSKYCENMYKIKIEELFIKMARGHIEKNSHQVDAKMYKALSYVRQTLQTQYKKIDNVEVFAHEIGLSASRFYVLYSKAFGITPKHDLINIRMEHAKHFLKYKFSVIETAELVGYSDVYNFSRQFKKQTGLTPLQYKEKYTQ